MLAFEYNVSQCILMLKLKVLWSCIVWQVLHCVVHYILMVRLADQSNISHPRGLPVSHTATTTNPHLTPWPTHSIRSWQPPIRMVTRIIKSQFCEPSFGEVLNFSPSSILYSLRVIFVQPLEKDHFDQLSPLFPFSVSDTFHTLIFHFSTDKTRVFKVNILLVSFSGRYENA